MRLRLPVPRHHIYKDAARLLDRIVGELTISSGVRVTHNAGLGAFADLREQLINAIAEPVAALVALV